MRKSQAVTLILFCMWMQTTWSEEPMRVRVIGQRVNLRARPNVEAEVVGQVNRDTVLVVKSFQDEWVEVAIPDSVDVWVHKDFVVENRVAADRLYVRGGPGVNWQSLGQLSKGEVVTVRGEFADWLKIAPPSSCSLWVNRKFVELEAPKREIVAVEPSLPQVTAVGSSGALSRVESARPQPREATPPRVSTVLPSPSPMEQVAAAEPRAAAAPPPPDLTLIPLEGQGRFVQREGVLRIAPFLIRRPSRYRLTAVGGRGIETICYVRSSRYRLIDYVGQRVLIKGREYWVAGIKQPVIVVEELIPQGSTAR